MWVQGLHLGDLPSDLDNSIYQDETHGATAPVTLINRLGSVSIIYAFADESGGEYWGNDLLQGVVLSPGTSSLSTWRPTISMISRLRTSTAPPIPSGRCP